MTDDHRDEIDTALKAMWDDVDAYASTLSIAEANGLIGSMASGLNVLLMAPLPDEQKVMCGVVHTEIVRRLSRRVAQVAGLPPLTTYEEFGRITVRLTDAVNAARGL